MTDPIGICTNKDDITNSAEISSSRDRVADSAEISGKNDRMTISHARRTKLCRDGDRAQKHAACYHSGGQYKSQENSRRLKGRRAVLVTPANKTTGGRAVSRRSTHSSRRTGVVLQGPLYSTQRRGYSLEREPEQCHRQYCKDVYKHTFSS